MQPERIYPIQESAIRHNIEIEYIETNASWYRDEQSSKEILRELMKRNVYTLLISMDPFHNEYIPFYKVKGLIEACSKVNMGVFPWLMEFWDDLVSLMIEKPIRWRSMLSFGEDYLWNLPKRYGLNPEVVL